MPSVALAMWSNHYVVCRLTFCSPFQRDLMTGIIAIRVRLTFKILLNFCTYYLLDTHLLSFITFIHVDKHHTYIIIINRDRNLVPSLKYLFYWFIVFFYIVALDMQSCRYMCPRAYFKFVHMSRVLAANQPRMLTLSSHYSRLLVYILH